MVTPYGAFYLGQLHSWFHIDVGARQNQHSGIQLWKRPLQDGSMQIEGCIVVNDQKYNTSLSFGSTSIEQSDEYINECRAILLSATSWLNVEIVENEHQNK